jgi:hypothetical protein
VTKEAIVIISQSIIFGNFLTLLLSYDDCSLLGGYDLLGRTKDQIRTTEQVNVALATCNNLKLDGFVIIGGIILPGSSFMATVTSLKTLDRTGNYVKDDISIRSM